MLRQIWNHFKTNVLHDQRGIWPAIIGAGASLLGSQSKQGGGGIFETLDVTNKNIENPWARGAANLLGLFGTGALFGGGDEGLSEEEMFEREFAERKKPATFIESPRFAETDAAREGWWSKLQEWGGQPGYGAIAPDWDSIWKLASGKIRESYRGGIGTTGALGRVKASAARRGVSESPALDTQIGRLGMAEGRDIGDLASKEAIGKAEFSESGRKNWLQSMMQMSNLQVPGAWDKYGGMQVSQPSNIGMGDVIADVGSGIAGLGMQYYQNQWLGEQRTQQQDWMKDLLDSSGGLYGGTKQSSITGNRNLAGSNVGFYGE